MKITKNDLIDHGIDPSLYNADDMEAIEKFADIIKDGGLSSLIEDIAKSSPDEDRYKAKIIKAREKVVECLKELSSLLDVVYDLCSSKQSVFASSLTPEETDRILVGSMHAFKKMFEVKDKALDYITEMFNFKKKLAEIRHAYNRGLYNAGMINAAFAVVCPNGDNSDILEASGNAFEKFNELTEINNDTNDRIIIFDEALNHKLGKYWNAITIYLDFDNDGKSLNTQKTKIEIEAAKQLLKDVIER